MADPLLAPLTHRPHPPAHGRAYAVFLRAGGFFNRDWAALVHRAGWAVPQTCPAELLAQARDAGETGLAVAHLLDLGLWRIPDLRAYDAAYGRLDPPGSWCVTALLWLDVVSRTDPATEQAAQAYWNITSLEAHPPGSHAWRLTDPVPETDPI